MFLSTTWRAGSVPLRQLLRSCPDDPHERKLLLVSVFVTENKPGQGTCSDAIRSGDDFPGPPSCNSQTVGRGVENKTGTSPLQG